MFSFGAIASSWMRRKEEERKKKPIKKHEHPMNKVSKEQSYEWLEKGLCQCCGEPSGEYKGICDECRWS